MSRIEPQEPSANAASPACTVLVNGKPQAIRPGCSVAGLLAQLDLAGGRIAVAVDRNVVPRSRYAEARLSGGERVEILEAVGGG